MVVVLYQGVRLYIASRSTADHAAVNSHFAPMSCDSWSENNLLGHPQILVNRWRACKKD